MTSLEMLKSAAKQITSCCQEFYTRIICEGSVNYIRGVEKGLQALRGCIIVICLCLHYHVVQQRM
jgi:hypothetical protein